MSVPAFLNNRVQGHPGQAGCRARIPCPPERPSRRTPLETMDASTRGQRAEMPPHQPAVSTERAWIPRSRFHKADAPLCTDGSIGKPPTAAGYAAWRPVARGVFASGFWQATSSGKYAYPLPSASAPRGNLHLPRPRDRTPLLPCRADGLNSHSTRAFGLGNLLGTVVRPNRPDEPSVRRLLLAPAPARTTPTT